MNDPHLAAAKLEELAELARSAESGFEKAAVFAATRELVRQFREDFDDGSAHEHLTSYAMEKVMKAGWHVGAMLGYDTDNGHDAERHFSGALGQLSSLKDELTKPAGS